MNEQTSHPEKKRAFDTYQTVVDQVEDLTPRNKGVRFKLPDGKTIDFKAGQFVQVFVPVQGDKPRRTSYSVASPPKHKSFLELCVTLVDGGKSSTYIHSLKVGDRVQIMGPLGRFVLPDQIERDIVFISTGSGIAPFRSMINDLFEKKIERNIYLIFGNRYDGDIIYQKEFEDLAAKQSRFKPLFTLSRPTEKWTGEKGYVQTKIEGFVPDPAKKDFYICGLTNMINAVQDQLLALGVPKEQIHYERYD